MMTEEQARTLYQQGEAATVAFLVSLTARIPQLEEQAAKNSGNSSKPPSSDGLAKPALTPMPQSLRTKTGRKRGGQKGHVGKTLLPVEAPDEVVTHAPVSCPHCHSSLDGGTQVASGRRQVFEMPLPRVVVTEHRAVTIACPCCAKHSSGSFPEDVKHPVQYGANLLGFATYLHSVHLLPYARCAQIVQDVTGAPFGAGSLSRALTRAKEGLDRFDTDLKQAVRAAPLLHADETGVRACGKLRWIHTRSTPTLCYLFSHAKRGKEAVEDLLAYNGRLISDFHSNYVTLSCAHQFCGAHLLRELTYAHDVLGQAWAGRLKAVMETMVASCHRARERGSSTVWNARQLARAFDGQVTAGLEQNPLPAVQGRRRVAKGKVRCLLERLQNYRDACLAFLFDLAVPFTNNEAERDLRMVKVKAKISGCFRTDAGADTFCRLRSYVVTCRKQGMRLLDCLRSVFAGEILLPAL